MIAFLLALVIPPIDEERDIIENKNPHVIDVLEKDWDVTGYWRILFAFPMIVAVI